MSGLVLTRRQCADDRDKAGSDRPLRNDTATVDFTTTAVGQLRTRTGPSSVAHIAGTDASGGELPICFGMVLVAVALRRSNFLDHGLLVGATPIEALARQKR